MREILQAVVLLGSVAACHPGVTPAPAPEPGAPIVTVRQVLTTQALAGAFVRVSGRCLAAGAEARALGPRPGSGQDWQLEQHGVAVWVQGPRPPECAATTAETTLLARVEQDTIPRLSRARMLRQYLVLN